MRARSRLWARRSRAQAKSTRRVSAIAARSLWPPRRFGGCDARFDLARLGVRRAEYAEAEKEFRDLLAVCREDAESRSGLGAALLGAGRTDDARGEFRRALELDPADFTALYNLGAMAADGGQAEQAAKLLEAALALLARLARCP
jgi:Flp pilus assembly protein TadD